MALTDNLVGVWCEAAAPETDESVNGETLTNNSVGTTTGVVGTAGTFAAASSQYLNHADDANLSVGNIDFTMAAWVWATTTPNHASVVVKRDNYEYGLELDSIAEPRFFFGANTISVVWSSGLSTGTWYHVVCWNDTTGGVIGISVNAGTPVTSSNAGSGAADSTGTFNIGRDPDFGSYWDGRLNQVALWKRVLTSTERTTLYGGGAGLPFASWGGAAFDPATGFAWPPTNNPLPVRRGVVAYQ